MAICMDTRLDHNHGMLDTYNTCETFGNDFYQCLCEDLARELDFPDATDLRRISQLELFGSSWETDPYQQLLLRCLDHSLPRLREQPPAIPRSRSFSIDYSDVEEEDEDMEAELDAQLPTNPPPSPALFPLNYSLSAEAESTSMLGLSAENESLEPLMFEKVHLLPPTTDNEDSPVGGAGGSADKSALGQRTRRQSSHRRVASTGLLATVVTGDGSVTWHFKKF